MMLIKSCFDSECSFHDIDYIPCDRNDKEIVMKNDTMIVGWSDIRMLLTVSLSSIINVFMTSTSTESKFNKN